VKELGLIVGFEIQDEGFGGAVAQVFPASVELGAAGGDGLLYRVFIARAGTDCSAMPGERAFTEIPFCT